MLHNIKLQSKIRIIFVEIDSKFGISSKELTVKSKLLPKLLKVNKFEILFEINLCLNNFNNLLQASNSKEH